jgi:hypothetical protein
MEAGRTTAADIAAAECPNPMTNLRFALQWRKSVLQLNKLAPPLHRLDLLRPKNQRSSSVYSCANPNQSRRPAL